MKSTLGILTWKAPRTLENSLRAWQSVPAEIFERRFVFCQEFDPEEMELARKYGFEVEGHSENIGIQNGLKSIAELAATPTVLIAENDCEPYLVNESTRAQLVSAIQATAAGEVVCMKLENRRIPGLTGYDEWTLLPRFNRYWPWEGRDTVWRRMVLAARRLLRPGVARAHIGDAIGSVVNPHQIFPGRIDWDERGFYRTSSTFLRWSNRSILVNREWFLEKLLPFAESHPSPSSRKVNGLDDLERPVNCPANRKWWMSQGFPIGWLEPGLTWHNRLDRGAGDEKVTQS